MAPAQPQAPDNDRSSGELRALDCNLAALCDHIQMEGFNAGASPMSSSRPWAPPTTSTASSFPTVPISGSPEASSQTLHALLTSDELWVPNEEKRFELALYTLLAKVAFSETDHPEQGMSCSETGVSASDSSVSKGKNLISSSNDNQLIKTYFQCMSIQNNLEGHKTAQNILVELADSVVDFHTDVSYSKSVQVPQETCMQPMLDSRFPPKMEHATTLKSLTDSNETGTSYSYVQLRSDTQATGKGGCEAAAGPSGESSCYKFIMISGSPRKNQGNIPRWVLPMG